MPEVKVKFDEEELQNNNRRQIIPAGWYQVEIVSDLEIGKVNFKFFLWKTKIVDTGDQSTAEFVGSLFEFRTIIEKGPDPKKSKRWLFHQAMRTCGVKKDGNAYMLSLSADQTRVQGFTGQKLWIAVAVKDREYNGKMYSGNEVKHINILPEYYREPKREPEAEKIPF